MGEWLSPHRLCAGPRAHPDAARRRGAGGAGAHTRAVSFLRRGLLSRSRLPSVPRRHRRAVADAADRLCRADFARPRRAPRRRRLHRRHSVPRSAGAVLAHAASGGAGRRCSRRYLRPAVAAPAWTLSRGVDARALFRRRLSRRRVREQARLLHRHHDRRAEHRRLRAQECPRLVFRAARRRHGDAVDLRQPPAQPHRAGLARDPRPRDRRRSARHRHRELQAPRLRHLLRPCVARGSAVRLLSRLRFGRGVFPVPVDPVRRHDHHRRHGIAARRVARRLVRDAAAVPDRGAAHAIAARAELRRVAVRDRLFRLRRGHDPVSRFRAARAGRHLAPAAKLLSAVWPFKYRPVAGTRR